MEDMRTEKKVAPGTAAVSGDHDLAWLPAWKLREMFAKGSLSPLEFAHFLIDRVDRHADLGAFISIFPEHLLAEAARATDALTCGTDLPPLHGLPVSIKDLVWTKGQRTTMGSRLFEDFVPEIDSVVSERLKAAGSIIFAKTNTPEFGKNRRTVNLVSRESLNPWDRKRTSGGSSGGSGVSAAAGLGPLSIGTDGGGSIRLPSAFNGVFGLHPSRGRVPDGDDANLYDAPMVGIGPMTRDVRDAAMLMQAIAGPSDRDRFAMREPAPDYLSGLEDGVAGVRMAWSGDFGRIIPEEPGIVAMCHEAARSFKSLGALYSEPVIRLEDPQDALEIDTEYAIADLLAHYRSIKPGYQDMFQWITTLPPEQFAQLSIYVRDRADRPTHLEYTLSVLPEVRNRRKDRLKDVFGRYDLLLSPTIARTAFVCGSQGITPWQYTAYTYLANVSGYCAASVPIGFFEGMPVGLQIMGRPNQDDLVLRAARAFERERPWAQHRPDLSA